MKKVDDVVFLHSQIADGPHAIEFDWQRASGAGASDGSFRLFIDRRFLKSYAAAPPEIRRATDKTILPLLHSLQHPSLHAKKYDEARGIWQARVTRSWRLYFRIKDDTYFLLDIVPHPK